MPFWQKGRSGRVWRGNCGLVFHKEERYDRGVPGSLWKGCGYIGGGLGLS